MNTKRFAMLALSIATIGSMGQASALNLTTVEGTPIAAPYVTYGDANSYSLPVLGILADAYVAGQPLANWNWTNSIQPGNPYYIPSTPGAIKDLTVIGTGANGQPVTTNIPAGSVDNAYPTPNSSGITYFSTTVTSDPNGAGEFTGDTANTWDIRLSSLNTFLDGGSTVFLFNNNQTKAGSTADETLAVWLRVTLGDDARVLQDLNLYLTNLGNDFALVSEGGGGVLNGTAGTGTLGGAVVPLAGTNTATDYVMSGGALCYNEATATIVSCKIKDVNGNLIANPLATGGPINHNLGADQAVYAVVFPELDRIMALANFAGYDFMNVEWRMGCDPATLNKDVNCVSRSLNNGFEQLFISSSSITIIDVPEPASLALLGLGLVVLVGIRRRKLA